MKEKKESAWKRLKRFGIIALSWADDIFYLLGSAAVAAGLDRLCGEICGEQLTVGLPVLGILMIYYALTMGGHE